MYFNSGHRWKLAYDAKNQSARKRKAAGILPFENAPPEIVKGTEAAKDPAARAARLDIPDYESVSSEDSDEDNMLSLEDPYPCRLGSGQA